MEVRVRAFLLLLLAAPASAAVPVPRVPLQPGQVVVPRVVDAGRTLPVRLTVKLSDAARGRAGADGALRVGAGIDRTRLDAVVARHGLAWRPLLQLDEARLEALQQRAERASGRAQPDLGGMLVVDAPAGADLARIGNDLQALPEVEWAFVEVLEAPPPGDLGSPTSDYEPQQGYLSSNPGIDARWAWAAGFTGRNVRLADCEYGWVTSHEDLVDRDVYLEAGQTVHPDVAANRWDQHGTAVLGELSATDNDYGCTGIAPESEVGTYPEWTVEESYRRISAITSAIDDSRPGDVVLLEMQAWGASGYGPAELNPGVWTVTRVGTDAGVVIVAAAGNGSQNLDGPDYDTYRGWGDSGAIVVGAGSPDAAHDAAGFSSFGSRVNLQGWGWFVFSLGYGDIQVDPDDVDQFYTAGFSGTSSASPIVTGAAILLQDVAIEALGAPLDPAELREILVTTGRAQGSGGTIGPLPDLRAALGELVDRYALGPVIGGVDAGELTEGSPGKLEVAGLFPTATSLEVQWRFDDGTTAEGMSVTHTFPDDGLIPVDVEVTDGDGQSDVLQIEVEVRNVAPRIVSLPTAQAREGTPVTLEANAEDPGDDELTYTWRFGGGQTATGKRVEWTFPQGVRDVELVVDDGDGGTDTAWFQIDVRNANPVITSVDVPRLPTGKEVTLSAVATDPGDDELTYTWDLGDGTVLVGPSVTHVFEDGGRTDLTLKVTDPDGGVAVWTDRKRVGCGCDATPTAPVAPVVVLLLGALIRRRRR